MENLIAKNLDLIPLLYVIAVAPIIFGYIVLVAIQRRRPPITDPLAA